MWICERQMPGDPIQILPRRLAEAALPPEGACCISIANPSQSRARLTGWHDTLFLGFHDTDRPGGPFQAMTLRDAWQVLAFARRHSTAPLTVHCEYGASRSVATGLFLAAWLQRAALHTAGVEGPNPWVAKQLRIAGLAYGLLHADGRLIKLALLGLKSYTLCVTELREQSKGSL